MAENLFDVSGDIQQSFGATSQNIQNVFNMYLQQKQRDFDMAQNALMNIEAIKNSANMYGQQYIKQKANSLLGDLSKSISEKGKLDYGQYGMLKSKISELADEKKGFDAYASALTEFSEMGARNKENLYSYEKLFTELTEFSKHPELMKNPLDLRSKMLETYNNNIDTTKALAKDLQKIVPTVTSSGIISKDGTESTFVANTLDGTAVDTKTGKIVLTADDNFFNNIAAQLEQSGSYAYKLQKEKLSKSALGEEVSGADIVKSIYNIIPKGDVKISSVKGERDVKKEEIGLDILESEKAIKETQAKNAEESQRLDLLAKSADIQAKIAQTDYYKSLNATQDAANSVQFNQSKNEYVTDLGKNYLTTLTIGDKSKNVYVKNIGYDNNTGRYKVGYFDVKQGIDDKYSPSAGEMKYILLEKGLTFNNSLTGNSLLSSFKAAGKNGARSLSYLRALESVVRQQPPQQMTTTPSVSSAIEIPVGHTRVY